ncbi:MAG TPA: flagellar filament capping protein FliD [Nitrospiraceae bacterium]|nr:flagellar filament capping protein FliD [Nitrospiraceae bacterium]
MSTSSSTIFNGNSRYASDFQSVIDRAVAIASLPLVQMQSVKVDLGDQSTALNSIDSKFSALQSALSTLETSAISGSLTSSISDMSVLKATAGAGAFEGSYSLQVLTLGSFASVMSSGAVSDPTAGSISTATSYTLVVGGKTFAEIKPTGGSLSDLATAINAQAGSDAQATVVNVGSSSSPSYRLSLQSRKLGDVNITLTGDAGNLLDVKDAVGSSFIKGEMAEYQVTGATAPIETDSRTVTLSTGLTVELLKESTGPVTVSVGRNANAISDALSSFAMAYNAVVDELDNNRGEGGGSVSGHSIVSSLSQTLRQLANYTDPTTGLSLATAGLGFDKNGKLTLESEIFANATKNGAGGVLRFLGGVETGAFLKAAGDVLNGVKNTSDGTLKSAIDLLNAQITRQDKHISDEEERINTLRESLQAQMAASDALIASLEQQVTYFRNMFQAMADASNQFS